jgi:hypothetical protein
MKTNMKKTMRTQCPFTDSKGVLIYEGDTIRHPGNKKEAKIVLDPSNRCWSGKWRAEYEDDPSTLLLAHQVDPERGDASVVLSEEELYKRLLPSAVFWICRLTAEKTEETPSYVTKMLGGFFRLCENYEIETVLMKTKQPTKITEETVNIAEIEKEG